VDQVAPQGAGLPSPARPKGPARVRN
jgi:hypothetical protein